MRKKFVFVVLALAIMVSLTAGSLAVYTKTVAQTEQVSAKRFAFSAAGNIAGDRAAIRLAPTESIRYEFTISNVDESNGMVAEVPLQFNVTIDYAGAAERMPGLSAVLYQGETVVGVYADGRIDFSALSQAGIRFENSYTVILTWADDGKNDARQTAAGSGKDTADAGLTLSVEATQAFPSL